MPSLAGPDGFDLVEPEPVPALALTFAGESQRLAEILLAHLVAEYPSGLVVWIDGGHYTIGVVDGSILRARVWDTETESATDTAVDIDLTTVDRVHVF